LETDYPNAVYRQQKEKPNKHTNKQNFPTTFTPLTPSWIVDKYCTPAFQFSCHSHA